MSKYATDLDSNVDLSDAELELINAAEKDLEEAGIEIPAPSTDEELAELFKELNEDATDETTPESTEAVVEAAPVVDVDAKWYTVKDGTITGRYPSRAKARAGKEAGHKVVKAEDMKADLEKAVKAVSLVEVVFEEPTPVTEVIKDEDGKASVIILETPQTKVIDIENTEPKTESKKTAAIRIFNEEKDRAARDGLKFRRAVVLSRYIREAGLSKAGGSTYFANIKLQKKGWTA